jgi:hypothetical protein
MAMPSLYRTRIVAVASVCAAAGFGLAAAAANGSAAPRKTLYLNSFESAAHDISPASCAQNTRCGPQVKASFYLKSGQTYTISVAGAVSVSGTGPKGHYGCGKPQPRPEFASPGIVAQPANVDAQFLFATPSFGSVQCPKLPQRSIAFLIKLSGSSRWFHPVAVGDPDKPSSDKNAGRNQHPYKFMVRGRDAAPRFRFADYHPSDNDGEFRIEIRAASGAA